MESLFQPVVRDLLGLVDAQATLAKSKTNRNVNVSKYLSPISLSGFCNDTNWTQRFVLVGGFADSDYLNGMLKRWCNVNGIDRFTCPAHWYVQ